jgi:broad specificity phosphatase PhoE
MIRFRLRALVALTLLSTPAIGAQGPAGPTTVILVRHAEKAAEPAADPPLTSAGVARADALAEMLKGAGVKAVVSTQFLRTRNTVAPIAARLGLTTEILDARLPAKATADSILDKHRGQTVLVVGHSNTVPGIVAALGAQAQPSICDGEYDNVYIVTVPPSGVATVVRAKYGVATPMDASCRGM